MPTSNIFLTPNLEKKIGMMSMKITSDNWPNDILKAGFASPAVVMNFVAS